MNQTQPAPSLIIFRGLPGSGKSTRAQREYPAYLHYEPDHLFCDTKGVYRFEAQLMAEAHKFVAYLADLALSRGENVVISDVFPKYADLERFELIATAHNADYKVITCTEQYGNCHHVPLFVLERMAQEFEE